MLVAAGGGLPCFVPTLFCGLLRFFFLRTTLPGVARQLLTFLVSPRKVSKRRRPRDPAPSGCPALRSKKWEGKKLAALRQFFLLSPFFASHHRLAPSGTAKLARCASPGVTRLRHRDSHLLPLLISPSSRRTLGPSDFSISLNRLHDAGFQLALERQSK